MEAMEELKKYGDVTKVEWKQCNLEDLHQTDNVAKDLSKLDRIDAVRFSHILRQHVSEQTY